MRYFVEGRLREMIEKDFMTGLKECFSSISKNFIIKFNKFYNKIEIHYLEIKEI